MALLIVMGLWLGAQILIPLVQNVERGGAPRPRPFGWQMFTHDISGPPEQFTVVRADGRSRVPLSRLLTGPARREVVLAPEVIAALCDRRGVLTVEVDDVERGRRTERCP